MSYIKHFTAWKTIGDDVQYNIVDTEDEFIIVFSGSNSLRDWKNNFKFRKKPYKNMPIPFTVHRGYLKVWKGINDFFLDLVKDVHKPITIVGHSYGGAIATLCHEDIWFTYPNKRGVLITHVYGSPRLIGIRGFRKIRERWKTLTIHENNIDIVSHVPFWFLGYRHVNKVNRLNDKSTWSIFKNHELQNYSQT